MNSNYHLDTAYIAGLFDGEGSLTYKKYKEKKKLVPSFCKLSGWKTASYTHLPLPSKRLFMTAMFAVYLKKKE